MTTHARSSEEASLMNARIREKKLVLKDGFVPQTDAHFILRADHMKKWFRDNKTVWNFLVYGDKHGFSWSQLKRWRKKSDYFSETIEACIQMCLERREEYLHKEGKLASVFLREQAVYNPMLADYEIEKAKNDSSVLDKYAQIALTQYQPLAQGIKDKEKE
jgi:hypothetical protein